MSGLMNDIPAAMAGTRTAVRDKAMVNASTIIAIGVKIPNRLQVG